MAHLRHRRHHMRHRILRVFAENCFGWFIASGEAKRNSIAAVAVTSQVIQADTGRVPSLQFWSELDRTRIEMVGMSEADVALLRLHVLAIQMHNRTTSSAAEEIPGHRHYGAGEQTSKEMDRVRCCVSGSHVSCLGCRDSGSGRYSAFRTARHAGLHSRRGAVRSGASHSYRRFRWPVSLGGTSRNHSRRFCPHHWTRRARSAGAVEHAL